ncbi:hypothetical protein LQ564_15980 [Massilia sp. G4R7]|uniref:Uncharacterized protein n=1 Tax=Massilia phyllostachyos TaxID=2898585 RepID=A0ABS8Q7U5_9BURK|nr:hypothetical protein [Massilia phyllostachyos]MCD2517812.1 hypothetical protein [Massilia phyllostachyos]
MKRLMISAMVAGTLLASAAQAATATVGKIERVAAFHGAMPTGVTVTETGRIFINFPKWGDQVDYTVAEVRDGKTVAYPSAAFNQENADPAKGLISVQSVVADGRGRLWILDTAAPGFAAPGPGAQAGGG